MTVNDLKTWHRRWLGNVLAWARQERSVNMGKQGFMFAAAPQIPRLLAEFERTCLTLLIHPFREGNGRLARLLADVMAVQAGREPLDYSAWNASKTDYIQAIHHGLQINFAPMKRLVAQGLNEGAA